ncbi:MAG: DUF5615 family PIN-like protein [Spirirestis rafaelensis WJT71-NPBG6]|nr:DUF5615 family PIN-like protein [Spirirestis rafaelensis WJT71-NPBG6]
MWFWRSCLRSWSNAPCLLFSLPSGRSANERLLVRRLCQRQRGSASLYADEQFRLLVVELLRGFGHDILTVQEAGNTGLPDPA